MRYVQCFISKCENDILHSERERKKFPFCKFMYALRHFSISNLEIDVLLIKINIIVNSISMCTYIIAKTIIYFVHTSDECQYIYKTMFRFS